MSRRPFLVAAFLLLASLGAWAQFDAGSVVGAVTDPSGSVIAGATVEIQSAATNVTRQTVTSATGEYNFPAVQPGQYTVTTKQSGFKDSTQTINLAVGQRLQFNFALEVGSAAQSVTITATVQTIDTASSEVSNIRTTQQVVDLPLNSRDFTQLVQLAPGVNDRGNATNSIQGGSSTARGANGASINGTPAENTVYLYDGIQSVDNEFAGLIFFPPVDSIQEFKVQTSSAPAAYGGSPGIINVTFRSGTNQLHGTLYEFLRNSALDAKNYFDSHTNSIPSFHMNQFGANLSGPIVIPHVFNGKDKLFFFMDYEGKRESQAQTYIDTVPTAAFRTGNFLALTTKLTQPGTTAPLFMNQVTAIDPTAAKVINLYPMPNTNLTSYVNNYLYNPPVLIHIDQGDLRIDYRTAKTSIFGRYSNEQPITVSPGYLPAPAVGAGPSFPGTTAVPGQQVVLGYGRSIGTNKYYEARVAYSRLYESTVETDIPYGDISQQLGIPNANAGGAAGLTNFSISGTTGLGDASGSFIKVNNNWEFDQAFSWLAGNHSLKGGFDFLTRRFAEYSPTYPVGQFTFNGSYTGYALADFLYGRPISSNLGVTKFFSLKRYLPSFYLQDDYRVTPKLTLNIGIRDDLVTPWVERSNRLAGFVPANGGTLVTVGTAPFSGNSVVDGRYTNWGPRFGFAYSLNTKTVIRGGAGIFYAFMSSTTSLSKNAPYAGTFPVTNSTGAAGYAAAQPISAGFPAARPNLLPVAGTNYVEYKPSYQNPTTDEWNLNIQRQLSSRDSIAIAYVAQVGSHVFRSENTNEPTPGAGAVAPRRPYPNLGDATELCPCSNSSFNSLQVTYLNHLSSGLDFQGAWTYGHSIDTSSGFSNAIPVQDPFNWESYRGSSDYDLRHSVVLSWTYALPFGKDKTFVSDAHGALQTVIGGWQLNSIDTFQSGTPFTPTMLSSNLNAGSGGQWPNRIGSGALAHRTVNAWFNLADFVAPAQYHYGNSGRNILVGPDTKQFDVSLFKSFYLNNSESRFIQARVETFNIFNTPQFDTPNAQIGSAAAGTITSAGLPLLFQRTSREIQLAMKVYW